MDKTDVLRALLGAVARGDADVDVVKIDDSTTPAKRDKAVQARVLRDVLPDVIRKNPFARADLVEQIPGYGSYRYPGEGHIAIVTEVFEVADIQRRTRGGRSEGPSAREDMLILCLVGDGKEEQWVEFSVESWRFCAYTGPVE